MLPVTAFGLFVEGLTRLHSPAREPGVREPERRREHRTVFQPERRFRNRSRF